MKEVKKEILLSVEKVTKGYIATTKDDFRGDLQYAGNTLEDVISAVFEDYLSIVGSGLALPAGTVKKVEGILKIFI